MSKMDVYSDMMVPMTVAIYCRDRKMHPRAVDLARKLRELESAKRAAEEAANAVEQAEANVRTSVQAMEAFMTEQGADRK